MALTKREQEIERMRDNAIKHALSMLLDFCDPTNENCALDPAIREASARYLETWVAGPLADALNRRELFNYNHASTLPAERYMELTK